MPTFALTDSDQIIDLEAVSCATRLKRGKKAFTRVHFHGGSELEWGGDEGDSIWQMLRSAVVVGPARFMEQMAAERQAAAPKILKPPAGAGAILAP